MFYPIENRVNSQVTIRRERILPRQGQIVVKSGDAVVAEDIIGRAPGIPRWRYLDLAAALKVPADQVERFLVKQLGDEVEAGEVIAAKKSGLGLSRRVCKSPAAGILAYIADGRALIEELADEIEVRALVRGKVVQVMAGYGAVVETRGALIRPAWGAGSSTYGVLRVLSDHPSRPLRVDQIDIQCHGAMLVAGFCAEGEVLRQAEQLQARALIVGSIPYNLQEIARNATIPIVVTEGFGRIPMNATAYELFRIHDGNEAALIFSEDGSGRQGAEIIIPISVEPAPPPLMPPDFLRVGQRVRLTGYPRLGAVGEIVAIPSFLRRVESGVLYEGVEVELENQELVFVPWTNVEPVG